MSDITQQRQLPSRQEADDLLAWAYECNPGPWVEHSRVVGRMAETVAARCGLDAEKAYACGLLHDVGRYEGVRRLHHTIAGYELLMRKGYADVARVCLTHSFPYQDVAPRDADASDCTPDELHTIESFVAGATYDDYDKLVQLGDSMCLAAGVCLIDVRLIDVTRRYGFKEHTLRKWDSIFALKRYFDELCGCNVYDLFYDEIRRVSFL